MKRQKRQKWYEMEWAQKYSQKCSHKYWAASKKKKEEMREEYHQYLRSDEWKAKRKKVLQAAGGRCQQCGAAATEVHHENYHEIYSESIANLTALCTDCHRDKHPKKSNPKQKSEGEVR